MAALYALKLTPGSVQLDGVLHLTREFDTISAMGKTALDVALATDALRAVKSEPDLVSVVCSAKAQNLCVGFLDIEQWRLPADFQVQDPEYFKQTVREVLSTLDSLLTAQWKTQAKEYLEAKQCLKDSGALVVDVHMTPPDKYMVEDVNIDDLMYEIISKLKVVLLVMND